MVKKQTLRNYRVIREYTCNYTYLGIGGSYLLAPIILHRDPSCKLVGGIMGIYCEGESREVVFLFFLKAFKKNHDLSYIVPGHSDSDKKYECFQHVEGLI